MEKSIIYWGKEQQSLWQMRYATEVLGEIPIEPAIREGGDSGLPICVLAPNSEVAKRYQQGADKLWDKLNRVNESGGKFGQTGFKFPRRKLILFNGEEKEDGKLGVTFQKGRILIGVGGEIEVIGVISHSF